MRLSEDFVHTVKALIAVCFENPENIYPATVVFDFLHGQIRENPPIPLEKVPLNQQNCQV